MQTWADISKWRKEQREKLLRERVDAGAGRRAEWNARIEQILRDLLPTLDVLSVGFYWPFKGEFDARKLVRELVAAGTTVALPAVVEKKGPLEFRRWMPGIEMESGVYNIPIPKARDLVTPELLLAPLVGFDAQGYRLGYGGGYFDRTFASLPKKPFGLGIGYELSRLETIYPQQHDIPMDAIVTENGTTILRQKT